MTIYIANFLAVLKMSVNAFTGDYLCSPSTRYLCNFQVFTETGHHVGWQIRRRLQRPASTPWGLCWRSWPSWRSGRGGQSLPNFSQAWSKPLSSALRPPSQLAGSSCLLWTSQAVCAPHAWVQMYWTAARPLLPWLSLSIALSPMSRYASSSAWTTHACIRILPGILLKHSHQLQTYALQGVFETLKTVRMVYV